MNGEGQEVLLKDQASIAIRYSGKPGQRVRMMDGSVYHVDADGSFRINKTKLSKKERRRYRQALRERKHS